jgi:hypothetical protein
MKLQLGESLFDRRSPSIAKGWWLKIPKILAGLKSFGTSALRSMTWQRPLRRDCR